jgi:hypothetical protein
MPAAERGSEACYLSGPSVGRGRVGRDAVTFRTGIRRSLPRAQLTSHWAGLCVHRGPCPGSGSCTRGARSHVGNDGARSGCPRTPPVGRARFSTTWPSASGGEQKYERLMAFCVNRSRVLTWRPSICKVSGVSSSSRRMADQSAIVISRLRAYLRGWCFRLMG